MAVDKWDRLLSSGRKVWGFAHDDSHQPHNDGLGWNVAWVRKDKANAAGIQAALREGCFYASTGVRIDWIDVQGSMLQIVADNAEQIEVYGELGRRLASVEGSELRFDADQVNAPYVRVQFYGRGAQMAWTQPFTIVGGASERRRKLEEQAQSGEARPTLRALRVKTIAPLDSEQPDAAWQTAPAADASYNANTGNPAPVHTDISALVSDKTLALRVVCREPLMDQIAPKISPPGGSSIWSDESVELFLDVEGLGQRYYHMMVNPLGAWYVTDRMGWTKVLKCEVRVRKDPQSWTSEFRLDLSTLAPGLKIAPGSRMGLHVSRNRKVVKQRYVWCWVGLSNHLPARYGTLAL
jgi:hypothetical protein